MSRLRPFGVAVSFLTRFPIHVENVAGVDFGRSVAWFPAVGLAFGLVVVGANALLGSWLAPELRGIVLVAIVAALSGGLHLDGLADTFDAVGGGKGDRERMLSIMRDSRIGAHGAIALFLLLAAKAIAVTEVLRGNSLGVLLVWPAVGRWAVIPLIVLFPYAREEGLGAPFREHTAWVHFVAATAFMAVIVARMIPTHWLAAFATTLPVLGLGIWMWLRLGGLTGDIYGAAVEVAETAFLIFTSSTHTAM
jgi:adenosylcobinamide-GDP ribazoletransferase